MLKRMPRKCCGLFGAHSRIINGDNFSFTLNVYLTPCTGSEVIKGLHILFKKSLQPYGSR